MQKNRQISIRLSTIPTRKSSTQKTKIQKRQLNIIENKNHLEIRKNRCTIFYLDMKDRYNFFSNLFNTVVRKFFVPQWHIKDFL